MNSPQVQKRSVVRKMLKAAGFGAALLLLILAGLLLWLRSDSGAKFVFEKAASALESSGFSLSASAFEGPLPQRLMIRDLELADAEGPLIKSRLVEVELKPLALLSGLAHVPLIKIEAPEVFRLPASGEDKAEESSGGFSLPVDVRLDKLALTEGRIHKNALASLDIDNPALELGASGFARLENNKAEANLAASVKDENSGHELAKLAAKLDAKPGLADQLDLDLKISDTPDGLIGALAKVDDWPGLELGFKGQGPLTGWNGALDIAAGKMGKADFTLALEGRTGQLISDFVNKPAVGLRLRGKLEPGEALPAEVIQWTGREVILQLDGQAEGRSLNAAMNITAARENAPLSLNSTVTGEGGAFVLASTLAGLLPDSQNEALELKAQWKPAAALSQKSWEAEAELNGTGLFLQGEAAQNKSDEAIEVTAGLKTKADSPWVAEGLVTAGLQPEDFGGDLDVSAFLNWLGPEVLPEVTLNLAGGNMRWPDELLTHLLGPAISFDARLSGSGTARQLEINNVKSAQISLEGKADYDQRPEGQSSLSADFRAGLASLKALDPGLDGRLDLSLKAEGGPADFKAGLAFNSDKVETAQGALEDISLTFDAAGLIMKEGAVVSEPDLGGRLKLTVGSSPGGPLDLAADWAFKQSGNSGTAALKKLTGNLADLLLNGDISADLGGEHPKIVGNIEATVSEWAKIGKLTGQNISGAPAAFKAEFSAPAEGQAALVNLSIPSLRIRSGQEETLSLKEIKLVSQADDIFGALGLNLDLAFGSGLAAGNSWSGGGVKAEGQGGSGIFTGSVERPKVAGKGGTAKDGLKFAGTYDLALPSLEVKNFDVNLAGVGISLREPLKLAAGENTKIGPVNLALKPGGTLKAEADLTPGAMVIKASLDRLPYSFFSTFTGAELPEGNISDLQIDMAQGADGLTGTFGLKTSLSAKELGNIKPALSVKGRLSGGSAPALSVEGTVGGGPSWKAAGQFSGSLGLSPGADGAFPTVSDNAPLKADLKFSGPVDPLWKLAGQSDRSLKGALGLQAEVGGTLARPLPRGSAYLAGGRYDDTVLGILVQDIKLEAHSTPELPLKALVSAKDAQGGGLALSAEVRDLANPALSAQGRLSRFSPINRDDLIVFLSGDFSADGPLDRLNVKSDISVDRGELDLKIVMAGGSIPTLEIVNAADRYIANAGASGPKLDVSIKIPNQFFIRGFGLDSEWRGDLNVRTFGPRVSLTGALAPVRGYFEMFSREFQFTSGDISFHGGTNPNLNLELTNQGPNIDAIITIAGNAQKPKLELTSRPPRPQEEVLSQVLFGRSASEISHMEALQLASGLHEISNFGKGGFNAIGSLREGIGLDVLRVGGASSDRERRASSLTGGMGQEMSGGGEKASGTIDDMAVEAGKYISDGVYVGVEHSGSGGAAVRLEVELAPSISLEAKTSTESSRVGIGWKKDY